MPGTPGLGIILGIHRLGTRPYFTIELGFRVPPNLGHLTRFGNIESKVEADKEGGHHVTVTLSDRRFVEVFEHFTRYVAQRLDGQQGPDERLATLRTAFREWETMLRSGRVPVLSEEEQRGLIAELWFLIRVLVPRSSPTDAITAWRGPYGDSHDFQFGKSHIEVKSSGHNTPNLIRISSAQQLDDTGLNNLFLAALVLETVEDGQSLPMAIEEARQSFAGHPKALAGLNQALQRAGYLNAQADGYPKRYRDGGWTHYSVDETFPRIIQPPNGITGLRYELDLGTARSHLVPEAEVWKAVGLVGK